MSTWQPIETAPAKAIDDYSTRLLLWVADGGDRRNGIAAFGRVYRFPDGSLKAGAEGFNGDWNITHWMPLPEPPKE